MPTVYQGDKSDAQGRYAIVVSRYNDSITRKLLDGAVATLVAHGIDDDAIEVFWVPGAWELPLVAQRLAGASSFDAIPCLGGVIRGETTHDEYINRAVSLSLARIGEECGLPVLFGVLTCQTVEQAIHRAGGNAGNKGIECAEAALEMVSLLKNLPYE